MKFSTPTTRTALLCVAASALLSACAAPSSSGTVYSAGEARREQIVRMGVVESVREVSIQRDPSGVGTIAGAVVGGIAGSDIGGGKGSSVASVLGAVAGGMVGSALENKTKLVKGYEITVRLDGGELRAYVQEADEQFKPGERVRLVSTGGTVRVTH
jgi:outer membrane lipoprotein SlyB